MNLEIVSFKYDVLRQILNQIRLICFHFTLLLLFLFRVAKLKLLLNIMPRDNKWRLGTIILIQGLREEKSKII